MGYRTWNNYERAAEQNYRAAWNALPLRKRILLRLRQAAILAVIFGLPAFLIARAFALL